nr:MAG TPA: hypothetical protein [Caudoviricetes sp.]
MFYEKRSIKRNKQRFELEGKNNCKIVPKNNYKNLRISK